jgi:hypothetical protein
MTLPLKRSLIAQSITDFYNSLSDDERREERAWAALSVAQWAKRDELEGATDSSFLVSMFPLFSASLRIRGLPQPIWPKTHPSRP